MFPSQRLTAPPRPSRGWTRADNVQRNGDPIGRRVIQSIVGEHDRNQISVYERSSALPFPLRQAGERIFRMVPERSGMACWGSVWDHLPRPTSLRKGLGSRWRRAGDAVDWHRGKVEFLTRTLCRMSSPVAKLHTQHGNIKPFVCGYCQYGSLAGRKTGPRGLAAASATLDVVFAFRTLTLNFELANIPRPAVIPDRKLAAVLHGDRNIWIQGPNAVRVKADFWLLEHDVRPEWQEAEACEHGHRR